MQEKYNDTICLKKTLISPTDLFRELPIHKKFLRKIQQFRNTTRDIIHAQDDRLLVVTGPCSIHDVNAAIEFAHRLRQAAIYFANELFIVMRVYFEKPRTTIGWKGLINDPFLDGTFDINHGLRLARKLLINLAELHVPAGTEFLDTIIPQYLSDLISWSAIGARTSESQLHRELASGLTNPVGFKNTTDGNIQIAIDAVCTARHPHHFLTIDCDGKPIAISTIGNDCCHIILRGSNKRANYSNTDVLKAVAMLKNAGLIARLMVDCSHGNSMKNYQNQITAAHAIIKQIKEGDTAIFGVMLESNLVAGNQALKKNVTLNYGQSITDGCIAWEETVSLLHEFALAVRCRRLSHAYVK